MNAHFTDMCMCLCSRSVWMSSAADCPQRRRLLPRTLRCLSIATPILLCRLRLPRAPPPQARALPPATRRPSRHWATQCHPTRTFSHSSRMASVTSTRADYERVTNTRTGLCSCIMWNCRRLQSNRLEDQRSALPAKSATATTTTAAAAAAATAAASGDEASEASDRESGSNPVSTM